jgi:hypothetical protein
MRPRIYITTLIAVALSGCASHEGMYSPACAAFAGSKISLDDGRFVWKRFTDSVVLDDYGDVVNQFPGYPKQGNYRIDGRALVLESGSGEPAVEMHLRSENGHHYLLTAEQFVAWESTGEYAECALILGGATGDG